MSNITKDQVIEWLSAQTILDLAALVKDLEGKWGVSAAAAAAPAAAATAAANTAGLQGSFGHNVNENHCRNHWEPLQKQRSMGIMDICFVSRYVLYKKNWLRSKIALLMVPVVPTTNLQ